MTMVGLGALNGMLGPAHPIYLCKLCLYMSGTCVIVDMYRAYVGIPMRDHASTMLGFAKR